MKLIPFSIWALLFFCTASLMIAACEDRSGPAPPATEERLQAVVADYVATYQAREDWETFLSFYSDSLYFLDINLRAEFHDKAAFAAFYDWPNPGFKKVKPTQKTFVEEDLLVADHRAIISGRFEPFYWQGELQRWDDLFVISLYFDDELKIVRQYDFIKYPKAFLPD